eukprot:15364664-Ditylum_brightwellii.AAC.2
MKIRHIGTQVDALSSEDVCLSMKLDDESLSTASYLSDAAKQTNKKSSRNKRKKAKTRARMNKVICSNRPGEASSSSTGFDYHTILDSGTEWTILGGPAWSVVKTYDKKLSMSAVDSAMSDVSMQC